MRDLEPALGLRDAKVGDPRDAVFAHHDVLGRNVAVDDAKGHSILAHGLVRGMKPGQSPDDRTDDDGHGDLLAAALGRAPQPLQRLAPHVLHDEEHLPRLGNHIQGGDHVGVLDPRGQPCLVQKHRDEFGIFRDVRAHSLDGHGAVESTEAAHPAEVDRRHATGRDFPKQGVASNGEDGARGLRLLVRRIHRKTVQREVLNVQRMGRSRTAVG